jgi:hypothetical protein
VAKKTRPAQYVPLSVTFATGKTGTAILERFGVEGLGAWAALLATAGAGQGQVVFRHEEDWAAIGLGGRELGFSLLEFLRFLGQRKQTRKTQHGRVIYTQLTRWEEWNNTRLREVARQQKSRKRGKSYSDNQPDTTRTQNGQHPDPDTDTETDTETEKPPNAVTEARPLANSGRIKLPELRSMA